MLLLYGKRLIAPVVKGRNIRRQGRLFSGIPGLQAGEEKASRRLCDILFLVEREKIMRERADEQNTVKVEPGGTPVPSLTHQNAEELLQVARLLVKAYDVGDSESIDWGDLDLAHTAAVKALEGIEGEMPNLIKRFTEIAEKLQDLSILDDIVHGGCDEDASKAINDEGLADDESAAEKIYDEYSEKAVSHRSCLFSWFSPLTDRFPMRDQGWTPCRLTLARNY